MYMYAHGNLEYTHTEVTNAMSTVYTTLDYEYRHKNKGTGLILVPRKCWVYKWDQKVTITRCVLAVLDWFQERGFNY